MNPTSPAPGVPEPPAPEPLLRLPEQDRSRLAEALQELLAHGSILGLESGQIGLYTWCRQNFEWLRETASLLGLDAALLHEERMVQVIPRNASMTLNLRQDATLVWLASDATGWITGADLLVDGGTRVRAARPGGYAVHDRLRSSAPRPS